MRIGTVINMGEGLEKNFERVTSIGIHSCQLGCWDMELYTDNMLQRVKNALQKYSIEISAFIVGWSSPMVWDFYSGPSTLGIVPVAYRHIRCLEIKKGADFAKALGVTDILTHFGFLPENPDTTEYREVLVALKDIAQYAKNNGQFVLFETGQETPITIKRIIDDIGTGNMAVNLDPANLLMYGKGNPLDAIEIIGEYIRGVHGKDGVCPVDGRYLGSETRIGEGMVNYPLFINKLKEIGFDGEITIEREISGDEQIKDVERTCGDNKDLANIFEGLNMAIGDSGKVCSFKKFSNNRKNFNIKQK